MLRVCARCRAESELDGQHAFRMHSLVVSSSSLQIPQGNPDVANKLWRLDAAEEACSRALARDQLSTNEVGYPPTLLLRLLLLLLLRLLLVLLLLLG